MSTESDYTKQRELLVKAIDEKQMSFIRRLCDPYLLKEDEEGGLTNNQCYHTVSCHSDEWNLPIASWVCCSEKGINKEFIERHIAQYPFVKMCRFSPKDWKNPPVFDSSEEAIMALTNSVRTRDVLDTQHLVMKIKREYVSQSRCFWAADRLRVVCGNMDKSQVQQFFERYNWDIPFHYCCVELGETANSTVEVIEINSFTEHCDPTPLEWSQNWEDLLFAQKVVWRDL